MPQSIGAQPTLPTLVMGTAQQAFMNSGHQKDKIRDMDEAWNLERATYTTMEEEYQAFKTFYTKCLRTMYADSHKKHMAQHTEEETWDKITAVEEMVAELEERQEHLSAMQTVTDTPTIISIRSADITTNSSIELVTHAVLAALIKSGAICNQDSGEPSGGSTTKPTWRKVQCYCYTHGANASHSAKDCKNPLGEHTSKPNATRCDTKGGSTKNLDKRNFWMSKGKFRKDKPN